MLLNHVSSTAVKEQAAISQQLKANKRMSVARTRQQAWLRQTQLVRVKLKVVSGAIESALVRNALVPTPAFGAYAKPVVLGAHFHS